ncbi:BlaI/MecI/CopY family transcriptional regulator [Candidatus Microgenomates bacterium]|nr:BlaI/MecI/CopY family transcriptional regulator [Candidatus Microgenomates bacterium]
MNTDQKVGKVLGELESEVMEIIWRLKESVSVRDVTEILLRKRQIAYTTVMTIMGRLVNKGLLKRKVAGKAYLYQPHYSKDKFLTRISHQLIKNFMDSFGEMAVAHFAQEVEKLAPSKRKQILKILKGTKK